MLPFRRPAPHGQHTREATHLLGEVRTARSTRASKEVESKDFTTRPMWTASYETPATRWDATHGEREKGAFKKALVGAAHLGEYARCVWCESKLSWHGQLEVDHFRPKTDATTWAACPPEVPDATPRHIRRCEGYWWLAYDWNNWLLSCGPCNLRKSTRFPRGMSASLTEGCEQHDDPHVLDPSKPFATREQFIWDEFGYIRGLTPHAKATIVMCGLNREDLVDARSTRIPDINLALSEFGRALNSGIESEVHRTRDKLWTLGNAHAEFAGMVRHFVEGWLKHKGFAPEWEQYWDDDGL